MTNKIYYLASCDTCRKIIKSLLNSDKLEFHDIRQNPITEKELEEMHSLSGSNYLNHYIQQTETRQWSRNLYD